MYIFVYIRNVKLLSRLLHVFPASLGLLYSVRSRRFSLTHF